MRNPFRRRRKLPGASEYWDEAQHIPLGEGEYVAIPADQLPAEAVERLSGVMLYSVEGGTAVLVDVTAAEAEAQARINEELRDRAMAQAGPWANREITDENQAEARAFIDATVDKIRESAEFENVMREITIDALNNRDNWVLGGVDEVDDGTEYSFMTINVVTGRIGDGEEGATTRSSGDPDSDALITAVEDALDANWGSPLAQEWQSLPGDYAELAEGITHSSDASWSPFLKCFLSGRVLRMLEVDRGDAAALPSDLVAQASSIDPYREAAEMLRTIEAAGERVPEFFAPGADTWDALGDWASVSTQLEFGGLSVNARAGFEFGYVMRCFEEARQG